MKRKIIALIIVFMFCLTFTKDVSAKTRPTATSNVELASADVTKKIEVGDISKIQDFTELSKYYESEISKYVTNLGNMSGAFDLTAVEAVNEMELTATDQKELSDLGYGNTEAEIRANFAQAWIEYGRELVSAFVPAELSATGAVLWGGSLGFANSCLDDPNCEENFHFLRDLTTVSRKASKWYPIILDNTLTIRKNDVSGEQIYFNKSNDENGNRFYPSKITDNGNVDDEGIYSSINTLKLTQSEYDKIVSGEENLNLYIYIDNPYSLTYLEFINKNNEYIHFPIARHAFNKYGVEVKRKSPDTAYYKKYSVIELDSSLIKDKEIYGIFTFTGGVTRGSIKDQLLANGGENLGFYYQFKINIEITDEGKSNTDSNDKKSGTNSNDKDIRDNNAKIYIDDVEQKIVNKKSWKEGRIYVELDAICSVLDCEYDYNEKEDTYNLKLPFDDSGSTVFALSHKVGTQYFESALKVHDEIYTFKNKILDASSFVEDGKLYVPLRFIVEGLGGIVEYYPSENNNPEKVKIYFNTSNIIDVYLNDKGYADNETIKANENYTVALKYDSLELENSKKLIDMKTGIFFYDAAKQQKCNIKDENQSTEGCDVIITDNNKIKIKTEECVKDIKMYAVGIKDDYPYLLQFSVKSAACK